MLAIAVERLDTMLISVPRSKTSKLYKTKTTTRGPMLDLLTLGK
jgi:hypothetical protein